MLALMTIKMEYYDHMMSNEHQSFIAQIHGLYMHTQSQGETVQMVVLKSIFPVKITISKQYDIHALTTRQVNNMENGYVQKFHD